ncbi:uncharacterized protein N7483_006310 [Penicillium malachiteum]|uniref:uncharacterized protein n=1 Tax=Penicillium malachiteum TaxID=1324776 RepID=UPI002547BB9C|nr:uncharacterized protein N7483_006310 [Penicillium malachiteum]KAJ5731802.1 hypothetical protein N7483_006310 [Penicillium malachiteum]
MFECGTCGDKFWWRDDCYEHMNYESHWIECETCDQLFLNHHGCNQHMDSKNHWAPQFPCETCNCIFSSNKALQAHMSAKRHWKNYCKSCDRQFQNENNLRAVCIPKCKSMNHAADLNSIQHLNSKVHRGTDMKCPFCRTGFVTASGVSHHLETGSCPKALNLNRQIIAKMMRRLDTQGKITNKQIEWHEEENVEYTVTNRAYNGHNWECYLCHREFGTARALTQHLNSSTHAQKAYHCPNRHGCRKQFVSLAALFNHLESESCKYMRFEKVQSVHSQLTDSIMGNKRIAFF